ncbi:MAG: NAD-glutamate dehydrogenase [Proteobacteria bacterium]|nr:NAD-glutamate dehydrogenase [Pseudomonadota bacterium]
MNDSALATQLRVIAERSGLAAPLIEEVYQLIAADQAFAPEVILREMAWFYSELGLDPSYFRATRPQEVAKHIQALFAGKILARTSGENVGLRLVSEHADSALYACRDEHTLAVEIERRIEQRYPDFRLECYRTTGTTGPDSLAHLRLYLLSRPAERHAEGGGALPSQGVGAPCLRVGVDERALARCQRLVARAGTELGPSIEILDQPEFRSKAILVAYRRGGTHSYFSAISDVLNSYGLHSQRKYIEQFPTGIVVYCVVLSGEVPEPVLESMREDISLVYALPRTSLTPLFQQGRLSAPEVVYAYACWKFAHQFLTRYREQYVSLATALGGDPIRLGLLAELKHRLTKDTFTEDRILETLERQPGLIKALYADFAEHHQRSPETPVKRYDREHGPALQARLHNAAADPIEEQILTACLTFNRHILTTNFYKARKVALAFRLDPAFLDSRDYPDRPHGIFFFVGSEFRGFHVRFREVARGGVRIVRSPTPQAFGTNVDHLFNEVYQLARTQQKKNKDIPEGGAKGGILMALDHQGRAETAFKKYVDSMLDLLLPDPEVIDHHGTPELIFLGPDEGTAELMNWASEHARARGYAYWRAFTTGKSPQLGGIPHDVHGMTTRSVHQYVLATLEKLGLDERTVTKLQTGGPDGDLGSNEIKCANDRTIAVVDGSGVLYDPDGLDRSELRRLAALREPIRSFERARLGPRGFLVGVEERDLTLPDGTQVESGFAFRDTFHLNPLAQADLFVPCGGRPDSVHINNVGQLIDARGVPRFRIIVEGANLFFTQAARIALEEAGVILFKDASANKGGVTSSSLEVLAGLALSDAEFAAHMLVTGAEPPAFYRDYVVEAQERIADNAQREFACIWSEHARAALPRSVLTDLLSDKISELKREIEGSTLWDNELLRARVLAEACPSTLQRLIGAKTILARVPNAYLKAVFGAHLASRYVYAVGLRGSELRFVEFLRPYLEAATTGASQLK